MSETLKSAEVAQQGNSAAISFTSAALEIAGVRSDDAVDVFSREDGIIIRLQRSHVTMAELLACFDPAKNRHDLLLVDEADRQ